MRHRITMATGYAAIDLNRAARLDGVAMVERLVPGNWYYFYPGQGNKAVNTTIDTFYVNQQGIWVH